MSKCSRFRVVVFLVAVGLIGSTRTALADPQSFHIIDINEIYSNADGNMQFVELIARSVGQTNLAPTWVIALNADGTDTNVVFDFVASFTALGNNETVLLATQDLADELGFQPDFVIPPFSLFLGDGRVIFEDPPTFPTLVDAIAYGNYTGSNTNYGLPAPPLPDDGCHSLQRIVPRAGLVPDSNNINWAVSSGGATPTRNDGMSATLPCPPVAPVLAAIGPKNVNEGQLLAFGVSATDGNADPLDLSVEGAPAGVNFVDNGNGTGSFTWTPTYLQANVYNLLFIVSDGGLADSEQVVVTVNEVTDPPVAIEASLDVQEDVPNDFLMSASDPDFDDLTYIITSGPFHGALSNLNIDPGVGTYTNTLNFNGRDSIFFHVNDGNANSNTAVHHFVVQPVNDPPVGQNVNAGTFANTDVAVGPMPITDVDDASWVVSHTAGPFHGSVSNFDAVDGSFDYTPALDYTGADTIVYSASDGHTLKSGNASSDADTVFITVASACDCSCHADPTCDGNPTVTDVVTVVNVAFRNGTDTIDPTCTHIGRTDVNCDCVVSVLDVVSMVNHAFRNDQTPFCDACTNPCP